MHSSSSFAMRGRGRNLGKILLLMCALFTIVNCAPNNPNQRPRPRPRPQRYRSGVGVTNKVEIVTDEEQLIRDLGHVLVTNRTAVIRFYADWCPVCRNDAPAFQNLVESYPASSVKFFKVDVDKHPRLISEYGIRAVPTYFILRRETRHLTFHSARDVNNILRRR